MTELEVLVSDIAPQPGASSREDRATPSPIDADGSSRPKHDELDGLLLAVVDSACRASFEKLYRLTSARTFGIIFRITRDLGEAEDVLQEAYVKVWHQCAQFEPARGRALHWISGIAHNAAISSVRTRKRRPQAVAMLDRDPYETLASPVLGPDFILIQTQCRLAVHASLRELPMAQRESLTLAIYDGLTQPEIAEHLGRPLGTVKSWIRRSLQALKPVLSAHH